MSSWEPGFGSSQTWQAAQDTAVQARRDAATASAKKSKELAAMATYTTGVYETIDPTKEWLYGKAYYETEYNPSTKTYNRTVRYGQGGFLNTLFSGYNTGSGLLGNIYGSSSSSSGSTTPSLALTQDQINQYAATQQEQQVGAYQSEQAARNAASASRGLRGGGLSDSASQAQEQAAKTSYGQYKLAAEVKNKELLAQEAELGISSRALDVQEEENALDFITSILGIA